MPRTPFSLRLSWLPAAALLLAAAPAPQLYRLALERERYLPAPLRVTAEDLVLELREGMALAAMTEEGPTALVLLGKGSLSFTPSVRSEQRQVELFAGSPMLATEFKAAFLRFHPTDFPAHVAAPVWRGSPPADLLRQAEGIFREEIGRSFAVEAKEAAKSSPVSVLPPPGDFLAEIRTPRHGLLTYARTAANPEDVVLIARERGRRIATYPSRQHMKTWGFDYGDEHGLPYEATHYEVEATLDPERASMAGRTLVTIRALERFDVANLRLDRGLMVRQVRSAEQGSHPFRQQQATDTLLVRFEPPLAAGREIELEVLYQGSVEPQELVRETPRKEWPRSPHAAPRSPSAGGILLYSNRVYWFPQSPVRNHTTATLRVTLPAGFTAVAAGIPEAASPAGEPAAGHSFFFRTRVPIRYLSLLIGKFAAFEAERPDGPIPIRTVASAAFLRRSRAIAADAAQIVRFYTSLTGDTPYPYLTVALLEAPVPAAHSPAYLSILGEPPGWNPRSAPRDPTYFAEEPVFSLAHEIAHQWWGHAVGWRNYREQWLSEGLAQYFAALYIRHARGDRVFRRVLAWMHGWALAAAGKGTISLGIRAGEITGCAECFPAIVYNRAAMVLHMLRGLLGEEAFFRGLRLYYERWKFRRAGTEDLRQALEKSSGRDLGRFFDQWIRDDRLPELRWSSALVSEGGRARLRLELEQTGGIFDLPLEISIDCDDRPAATRVLRLSQPKEEFFFDLEGRFQKVRFNEDFGALCLLRERRR